MNLIPLSVTVPLTPSCVRDKNLGPAIPWYVWWARQERNESTHRSCWCIFLLQSWISFCLSSLYPMLTCYVLTLLDPNVSETPSDWCCKWEGWWMIPCRENITESFLKNACKSGCGMHSNWAAYSLWAFITIRPWHIAWFLFGFFSTF